MTADDSIKCPCVNSGMTGKWVVFKIDGFVCTRFLPFSPTPPRSFTCAIFYRGLWLFFFIVLWSYGRKIWLNMCHGNSENSYGCSYLLRICFIYGTNVSVSRSLIPLQVVDRSQTICWFTNKQVQIKILAILKLVSFESLAGNDFSERGTQAKAHCERNLNRQL